MGAWRVEQHYGVGAANVRLCPEPYLHPDRTWGLFEGLGKLREDIHGQGRSFVRSLAILPIGLLGLVIVTATVITAVRERVDSSMIEMVMFRTEPLVAQIEPEVIPEPEPIPEPKPVVKPEPKPVAVQKPKPPERKIAKLEPPKPPPVIAPPKPKPVPPPQRAEVRRPKPPPPSKPRPVVRIDAIAKSAPVVPPPSHERMSREVERQRRAVTPSVAPIARLDTPSAPPPPESNRFASVRPQAQSRSRVPSVAPMIASSPAPPAAPAPAPTRQGRRPERPTPSPRALPAIEPTGLGRIENPTDVPRSASTRRADRPVRSAAQGSRRRSVDVASLAAPSAVSDARPGTSGGSRGPAGRTAVAAPTAERRSQEGQKLRGVPLGSLASCVTDREEDGLKQRIVAAVTTQKACVSRAGTYQFVETKNLNSFLMWVAPAQGRTSSNRCDELRLAISCLDKNAR